MAHVVFLRAANVGGKNVFRPAELARTLSHIDAVNIGAAGTFVIRSAATQAEIRREIAGALPFAIELTIRPAKDVVSLVRAQPFAGVAFTKDLRGWVATLAGKPAKKPALPVLVPNGPKWAMRLDMIEGAFACGIFRRQPGGLLMSGNMVEPVLGVRATVRWWETFEKIAAVLEKR